MSLQVRANFLMVVSIVFFVYSLLWALAPFPAVNFPARFILDLADWPVDSLSVPLDRNTQWLSAIGAGILAAVSVFLGGIVVPAIRQRNVSVIRVAMLAMVVWYVIDGVGSVASGVGSNVFFNSIYLGLVLIPLVGVGSAE